MKTKINAIITGVTGMVGEGVLLECLQHADVESVLVINRKPCGINHPKLKEIIHKDFFDLSAIENQLSDYNACFFCLGISSVGVAKGVYFKMTHTLTMHFAETLEKQSPNLTFCYVSGASTDSTENGKINWARVKGKTENDLMKMDFDKVFPFRPGILKPTDGMKNTNKYYKYIGWFFPIGRRLFPKAFCTLKELGLAMINSVNITEKRKIFEVKDIVELASTSSATE